MTLPIHQIVAHLSTTFAIGAMQFLPLFSISNNGIESKGNAPITLGVDHER